MKERILIVDDEIEILAAMQRNLRNDYLVTVAKGAKEALEIINSSAPFAVILSDFKMPEMNGLELLRIVKSNFPDTIRVLLTGYADLDLSIKAINDGYVFRFLTKPVEFEVIKQTLNECIQQYKLVTAEKELLDKTLKGTIKLLIDIMSITNPKITNISGRIRAVAKDIAMQMNIQNTWEIEIAGLLSQLGFIALSDEVADKIFHNKPLTKDEAMQYKESPAQAAKLIELIPRLKNVAEGIKFMFLNYDGSNCTLDGFKENKIPLISRILKASYDFNFYIEIGFDSIKATEKMMANPYQYDPTVLNALLEVNQVKRKGFIIKSIPYKQLRIGMILAENLKDEEGMTLISKGQEITDAVVMRLMTIARSKKIQEPIRIVELN